MIIKIAILLALAPPVPLMALAQYKLNLPSSSLQQRWNLTIERPEDEQEEANLIKDAQSTLKGHYYSLAINGEIILHLKGSEDTLLKKLEGKTWFDKSKLKKIETRQ